MTVFLRDLSDYDGDENLSGFVGATHKATEGTTVTHQQYGRRLNLWRSQGYRVLGAYHVLRTPGSGGNGSLSSQLDFWLSNLDAHTPWWRDQPFILQIDAEKWPYDPVSLTDPLSHEDARRLLAPSHFAEILAARVSTTIDFATLLLRNVPHGYKVCYASRGQYGNNLTGIPIDLWNAAYRSASYPGDGSADWAPYSGRTPVLWQYTSTPYDKNAFRGSVDELLTLIGATMTSPLSPTEQAELYNITQVLNAIMTLQRHTLTAWGNNLGAIADTLVPAGAVLDDLRQVLAGKPDDPTKPIGVLTLLDEIRAAVTAPQQVITLTDAQMQTLATALTSAVTAAAQPLQAEIADLRAKLAAALSAAGQAVGA